MQTNWVNGWREVLARVFAGFDIEYGLIPEWLVNPETNRRLKLDYFMPEIAVAVRFIGLEGTARKRRKSDEELADEADREQARADVCRAHGVVLVSIDPNGEPAVALRGLEMGLARAASQLARGAATQAAKKRLMPMLSQARQRAGEFTTRLTSPERLGLYAEMWWERQASLATQAPAERSSGPIRSYRVGMAVEHTRFGPGQIIAVEPDGGDVQVKVVFEGGETRSFYASLARDKLIPC